MRCRLHGRLPKAAENVSDENPFRNYEKFEIYLYQAKRNRVLELLLHSISSYAISAFILRQVTQHGPTRTVLCTGPIDLRSQTCRCDKLYMVDQRGLGRQAGQTLEGSFSAVSKPTSASTPVNTPGFFLCHEIMPLGFRAWGAPISRLFLAPLREHIYSKIASHAY